MSSPAIFPVPLSGTAGEGNVWWWDIPPTVDTYYDEENHRDLANASPEAYSYCWFVDYDELLHRHTQLSEGNVLHTFAYAAIAQRKRVGDHTACELGTRGWVEIDAVDESTGKPYPSSKRVTKIPRFFRYDYDLEAKDVSFTDHRSRNPLRDVVGSNYIRRQTRPADASTTVTGVNSVEVSDSIIGAPVVIEVENLGTHSVSEVDLTIDGYNLKLAMPDGKSLAPLGILPEPLAHSKVQIVYGDTEFGEPIRATGTLTSGVAKVPDDAVWEGAEAWPGHYTTCIPDFNWTGSPKADDTFADGFMSLDMDAFAWWADNALEAPCVLTVMPGDGVAWLRVGIDELRTLGSTDADDFDSYLSQHPTEFYHKADISAPCYEESLAPGSVKNSHFTVVSNMGEDCMITVTYPTYDGSGLQPPSFMQAQSQLLNGQESSPINQGVMTGRCCKVDAVVHNDKSSTIAPVMLSVHSPETDRVVYSDDVLGPTDGARLPIFRCIPLCAPMANGGLSPFTVESLFVRHAGGEAGSAVREMTSYTLSSAGTNSRYVAIPTIMYHVPWTDPGYPCIVGVASMTPGTYPTMDAEVYEEGYRTIVDYKRDSNGVSPATAVYTGPEMDRIERMGFVDQDGTSRWDTALDGNSIYPCEYVCADEDNPEKSWFAIEPYVASPYIGTATEIAEGTAVPSNPIEYMPVEADEFGQHRMYISDDLSDGFGFVVCDLGFPTDYYSDYFGKLMWFRLRPGGDSQYRTLRTLPGPLDDTLPTTTDYHRDTVTLKQGSVYPCVYAFTLRGERWYWVNNQNIAPTTQGEYPLRDNFRWFTTSMNGQANGEIEIYYKDVEDGSVRYTVE